MLLYNIILTEILWKELNELGYNFIDKITCSPRAPKSVGGTPERKN